MRIEGYPPFIPPHSANARPQAASATAAEDNLSPQEKLARLLDEKRWMTESAFGAEPSGELGKNIDLRV